MRAICYCRKCQKQAGTAFAVVIAVPRSALKVDGELKRYADKGDSGLKVHRNFCPDCGSPVTTDLTAMPDLVFVKAGMLDDTSGLTPTMEIFCSIAQPWTSAANARTRFAKGPG